MEMATKLLYSSKLTIDEIMYREGIKENTLKTLGATLS